MAKESKGCSSDHLSGSDWDKGNCGQRLPGGDNDDDDEGDDGHEDDDLVTFLFRAPQRSQLRWDRRRTRSRAKVEIVLGDIS